MKERLCGDYQRVNRSKIFLKKPKQNSAFKLTSGGGLACNSYEPPFWQRLLWIRRAQGREFLSSVTLMGEVSVYDQCSAAKRRDYECRNGLHSVQPSSDDPTK